MTPCIESEKKIILLLSSASWIYPNLATDAARVRTRTTRAGPWAPGIPPVFDLAIFFFFFKNFFFLFLNPKMIAWGYAEIFLTF